MKGSIVILKARRSLGGVTEFKYLGTALKYECYAESELSSSETLTNVL
jgi:hypothetical protein